MDKTQIFIEAFGYLGSTLVLVSFLMVSVFKLRIVNTIGSVIFTIYAFIIHSYPTAIMNACLVCINVYYLIKMSNTGNKEYDFIKTDINESLIKYTIEKYKEDILNCFPGISMDFSDSNCSYVVCHNGKPTGIMVGRQKDGVIDILMDYSIPEYRDFSIATYLFSKLKDEGIKTLVYNGPTDNHKIYLEKTGFEKKGDHFEKQL